MEEEFVNLDEKVFVKPSSVAMVVKGEEETCLIYLHGHPTAFPVASSAEDVVSDLEDE